MDTIETNREPEPSPTVRSLQGSGPASSIPNRSIRIARIPDLAVG
jgi:hypothetical protein